MNQILNAQTLTTVLLSLLLLLLSSSSSAFIIPSSTTRTQLTQRRQVSFTRQRATMTMMSEETNAKVLGVCGGIGTGKSFVCSLLVEELGCVAHIDADKIAHQVYQPNSPVLQEIASEFGSAVLTEDKSEINRKELGKIVFADSNAMKKLEQIVWPHAKNLIRSEITQLSTNTTSTPSIIVLEAAILLDAQWDDLCDAVWIITAPYDIALQRLIEKRSMKQEDAQKRMDAQEGNRGLGRGKNTATEEMEKEGSRITAIVNNDGNERGELVEKLRLVLKEEGF